ncbi:24179_t:CDS:2 [Cetraspora pellucida]|uniref:24179_t:CDS:1 n=1 Tax=Cetraspora pellucida TaxID=1433469 RepID=A0A9N9II80_9GLOM|nr:24179_t:CDS:2 [Cetraspora pellucida]
MVSEDPEESFLDFSMKYLDAVFGTSDTPEPILPRIEVNDLSPSKPIQASSVTTNDTSDDLQAEQKEVQEISNNDSKINSSVSVTPIQAKCSTDIRETNPNITGDSSDSSPGKLFPGLVEATLKRKSVIGLEDYDTSDTLNSESITGALHIETDNPSHLFWVPAHLHPEIAPNEFRKWLNNHAKDRFNTGTGSLRRRKSALSRQYIPMENDDDEQSEKKVEPEKKRNGFDWMSFATSEEKASKPTKIKTIRRSLSLNMSPFVGSDTDPKDPNIFDRHSSATVDSPVLIPRMAPALKRAARTKIRRNSVAGEQNPRRFSAHRRTKSTHVLSDKDKQNGNFLPIIPKNPPESLRSDVLTLPRNEGFEETGNEETTSTSDIVAEPEEIENDIVLDFIELNDSSGPIRITLKDDGAAPASAAMSSPPSPRRTSSLPQSAINMSDSLQGHAPSQDEAKLCSDTSGITKNSPKTLASIQSKRTSTWTSWFFGASSDDKESKFKKPKADKVQKADGDLNESGTREKSSKITISSIFSWSSQSRGKSTEEHGTSNVLLSSPSTSILSNKKPKYTNYNRFPIHVERAIYRLSHIKLANPRRPLHEQVLISNMMFWYLSLINKQQIEYGSEVNPNAEKVVAKVKSKVGKHNGDRKRRKGEKKGSSDARRRGAGSSAEIAYKTPQYDIQQISQQYLTPPMSPSQANSPYTLGLGYSKEFDDYSDSNPDYSCAYVEDAYGHRKYYHYGDGYISDGTDGGYLDDQDRTSVGVESSHVEGLVYYDSDVENVGGESSNRASNYNSHRPASPNRRSPSPDGRSLNARPSPNNQRSTSPVRPLSPNSGIRNKQSPFPSNNENMNIANPIIEDEDDNVPLGLYKTTHMIK